MVKLTKFERRILNAYVQYPFATYAEIDEYFDVSVGITGKVVCEIRKRITQQPVKTRLQVFQSIGWVRTFEIDDMMNPHVHGLSPQNVETLKYLQQYPACTVQDIADVFCLESESARFRFMSLYSTFGLTGLPNPRLRLYAVLGWYIPTWLPADNEIKQVAS